MRLSVLETPGHTPEGISLLVRDLAQSDRDPLAVLTGDTLFIGDVGRPDLLASIGVTEDELAEMLYDSLNNKLWPLPDATLVYPAHGAGSMCGKQLSTEAFSTIGDQRKYNYALQPMSREEFKRLVTADQAEAPNYFVNDAILKEAVMRLGRIGFDRVQGYVAGGPKALEQKPELIAVTQRITGQALADEMEDQAMLVVVDVRAEKEWQDGHIAGSINVPLSHLRKRAAKLPKDKSLVVHCKSEYRSSIAASILQQQGFRHVFDLVGGFDAWTASKLPIAEEAAASHTASGWR